MIAAQSGDLLERRIIIQVRDLVTRFGHETIHDGINLDICQGEIIGLVGGSGSGKSTLLRALTMLLQPSGGSIRIGRHELIGIDEASASELRRHMGVMFQQGALFSSLTVLQNVCVPLKEQTQLSAQLIQQLGLMKLKLVGLTEQVADKYPKHLSGGMIKRVAVARALALDPDILFLDEPSAGLDPISAHALDELILQLRKALGLTVVIVTHDIDSLWRLTDRVAFLGEKRLLAVADLKTLSQHPHPLIHEYFQGPRGRAAQVK